MQQWQRFIWRNRNALLCRAAESRPHGVHMNLVKPVACDPRLPIGLMIILRLYLSILKPQRVTLRFSRLPLRSLSAPRAPRDPPFDNQVAYYYLQGTIGDCRCRRRPAGTAAPRRLRHSKKPCVSSWCPCWMITTHTCEVLILLLFCVTSSDHVHNATPPALQPCQWRGRGSSYRPSSAGQGAVGSHAAASDYQHGAMHTSTC